MINGTFSETSKMMNTSNDDMSVILNVTFLNILYHSILALVLKDLFYFLSLNFDSH